MLWRDRYATINVTALVHEAWLKLRRSPSGAFSEEAADTSAIAIAIACRAMHQFLVDHARRRKAAKRKIEVGPGTLIDASAMSVPDPETTLALDSALKKLAHMDARAAQMVMLRYYGGLDWEETGAALGVSPKTLQNEWKSVKAFLLKEMRG
jgi:RNA polymerase sigma factor (TIGR02999 family)